MKNENQCCGLEICDFYPFLNKKKKFKVGSSIQNSECIKYIDGPMN